MESVTGGTYKIIVEGLGTYYGESENIQKRWKMHTDHLRLGKHHNEKLQIAWNILGYTKFKFVVIEQNLLLTKNKQLRLIAEDKLIKQDPLALNVIGMGRLTTDSMRLPKQDKYLNKVVLVKRQKRKQIAEVYFNDQLIGLEIINGKWRQGLYKVDNEGFLTRVRTPYGT